MISCQIMQLATFVQQATHIFFYKKKVTSKSYTLKRGRGNFAFTQRWNGIAEQGLIL